MSRISAHVWSLTVLAAPVALIALFVPDGRAQQPLPTPQRELPAVIVPPPAGYSQAGTAVIRGRVVSSAGLPLRRAELRLSLTRLSPAPIIATDDDGRFEFTGLPAGRFILTATKTGYLPVGSTLGQPTGVAVEVAAGQRLDGVDVVMQRGSTVAVRVVDDLGGPISGVRVFMQYITYVIPGQRNLQTIRGSDNTADETDDRGIATFSGVPPGEYYITASPAVQRPQVIGASDSGRLLAITLYPGTTDLTRAELVKVGAAQDLDVTFPLQVVKSASVSGSARSSNGAPLVGSVQLSRLLNPGGDQRNVAVQPDGSFRIDDVMPGDYSIFVGSALPADNPPAREIGTLRVRVDGEDVTGLAVTTSLPAVVRGKMVFEDGAPPAGIQPGLTTVMVYGAGDGQLQVRNTASWKPDWTFEMSVIGRGIVRATQISPQTSIQRIGGPPGWYLKAVRYDGRDITDTPFDFVGGRQFNDIEVVLTQKRPALAGTVTDARNAPAKLHSVVVFAEDPKLRFGNSRFIARGRSDDQGRYRIDGLAPGRYLVAAVPSLQDGQEYDGPLLTQLEADAVPVSLADGDARTLNLRVRP